MDAAEYDWSEALNGLQLGLRASATTLTAGGWVDLTLAARNLSAHPIELGNRFSLVIEHGSRRTERAEGPRSARPLRLEPGATMEFASWRLADEISRNPGSHRCQAVYRMEGKEIRSKVVTLEVRG